MEDTVKMRSLVVRDSHDKKFYKLDTCWNNEEVESVKTFKGSTWKVISEHETPEEALQKTRSLNLDESLKPLIKNSKNDTCISNTKDYILYFDARSLLLAANNETERVMDQRNDLANSEIPSLLAKIKTLENEIERLNLVKTETIRRHNICTNEGMKEGYKNVIDSFNNTKLPEND